MGTAFSCGMNIHNRNYLSYPQKDIEKNIDACKELGMEIVRFNHAGISDADLEEIKNVSDLCHARDMKLMLVVDKNFYSDDDMGLDEREEYMRQYYKRLSSCLRDKVDYYQIFNEMDVACMNGQIVNIFLPGKDGKEKGEYDYVRWDRAVASVKGALKGVKEGYADAKTCINFGWWHTALIYELYDLGLRFDIVGLDWYSDCEEVSSIELLMKNVEENIPDCDIMICETNLWMNLHERYSDERKSALQKAENRDKWQAEWIPEFLDILEKINDPRL
ncbi:MAG: hypothetical protein J5766_00560, partial [Clostridia bacterium]|nr:hypothetical protein [Clostridia bacterium]